MSADTIARHVKNFHAGRLKFIPTSEDSVQLFKDENFRQIVPEHYEQLKGKNVMVSGVAEDAPTVDCTKVCEQVGVAEITIVFGDYEIRPVWPKFTFAWIEPGSAGPDWVWIILGLWEQNQLVMSLYGGGTMRADGTNEAVTSPILGPFHTWALEVEDGRIVRGKSNAGAVDLQNSLHALAVALQTLTLAACTNVEIAEPHRPKPQRKRIARTGVTLHELVIRPTSKSYRSASGEKVSNLSDVPMSFVRGHFAEYGRNGKGLLFGKYSGRFWIPAHARGNVEDGHEQKYVVQP